MRLQYWEEKNTTFPKKINLFKSDNTSGYVFKQKLISTEGCHLPWIFFGFIAIRTKIVYVAILQPNDVRNTNLSGFKMAGWRIINRKLGCDMICASFFFFFLDSYTLHLFIHFFVTAIHFMVIAYLYHLTSLCYEILAAKNMFTAPLPK